MALTYEGINLVFDCEGIGEDGERDQGIIEIEVDLSGEWLNLYIESDPIEIEVDLSGEMTLGGVWDSDPIEIEVGLNWDEIGILIEQPKGNWVAWSDIGVLNFTIKTEEPDNLAGQRPLDWPGLVTGAGKLGGKVVAYGSGGVSILTPVERKWGLTTIHRVGLKSRDSWCGNDNVHFFVDAEGCLYQLGEQLSKLGYEEFLASLGTVVLSLDETNGLVYICDGTAGYVYSMDSHSLGAGPVNITGIGYQGSTQYITAPAAITIPTPEFWTDIYDLGYRNGKNIQGLEIGTNLTVGLNAAIRIRMDKAGAFSQTDWYPVDARGVVFIPCYGYEFQFGFKADSYEYFEIDYIKVIGEVNAY